MKKLSTNNEELTEYGHRFWNSQYNYSRDVLTRTRKQVMSNKDVIIQAAMEGNKQFSNLFN